ncbi:F-box/kelch-repeat protein At1g16250 isoform X2 [Punica granatum]|uniref:F-box/kelch-repeat protein At1g16250 isoform X2 n=1 Tax=Punica granatum TaxID=22663 RepID=A0A6P8DRN7_PUNGR|nr:F-box/kelch-repeat protein At1g16250 isoform X2 [Punica granatum]XP_031397025.1 F-box/kelch-repeat protein At1g16250 isoform X2 [Punica granatum]
MESMYQPIIPGLPDDLALYCLARLSHGHHGLLETVSKRWRDVVRSDEYSNFKAREGWCGDWLFVLTEGMRNQWVAYDPEADRWHPVPLNPRKHLPDRWPLGFSCVCVNNKFLVIGGSYELWHPRECSFISKEVVQFDPFKKEWSSAASMRTPRSHFACCIIDGKIYVAGGRNSDYPKGITLAEVYDPLTDSWEDLPPMPIPLMDCIGIAYKGNFHVLSDTLGLQDRNPTEVFDPSNRKWCIKHDNWPFSRASQVSVQVTKDDRLYTVEDWGESIVKTRDAEKEEWDSVGKVPPVFVSNHSRPLEAFDYGFAALGHELYVVGGKVLKWEELGVGRFEIVKLDRVRVCDPTCSPLSWRETRPMCLTSSGSILGCTSLKETSPKRVTDQ